MTSNSRRHQDFSACMDALRNGRPAQAAELLEKIRLRPSERAAQALKDHLARAIAQALSPGGPAAVAESPESALRPRPRPSHVVMIVTPAHNAARFIDETIASVVSQRGDLTVHYHVQDALSTDGTPAILRRWEEALASGAVRAGTDLRFSWASEADAGMYDAIARGYRRIFERLDEPAAQAAVMTWINADDVLCTRSLWTASAFLEEHPEIQWVVGLGSIIDESGAVTRSEGGGFEYAQAHVAAGRHDGRDLRFLPQEGTFWRAHLWQQVDGLNARAFRLAGDWDLWRRFAEWTPPLQLDSVLALHRRHAGQLSADLLAYYEEVDRPRPARQAAGRTDALRGVYDSSTGRWNIISGPVADPRAAPAAAPEAAAEAARQPAAASAHDGLPATLPSGRPWPRISVVTPSYNQGIYIEETIRSVLDQDYPDVEHLIIDGGSTDGTLEVMERYRDRVAYMVSERDKGQSDALNKGFRRATGEILCWLNSDDRFAPGALRAVALAFDTHAADMVSGICEIYEDGVLQHRHISACEDGPLPLDIMLDLDTGWNTGQFFYQPEVFFTRDLWVRAGAHVRTDCYYSMDYELWCRFAHAQARLHVIASPLAYFRVHSAQKTADPAKFKAELLTVREEFARARGLVIPTSRRPEARWDRVVKVAMVNDIGLRYGAGIAQGRIAAGIDMAGHEPRLFELSAFRNAAQEVDEDAFVAEVVAWQPDLVIFGNMHSADRSSVKAVDALSRRYPSLWVTHDFWLFTGRCAYPGPCTKYLQGCDELCPTPTQYPDLAPERIRSAWQRKRELLNSPHAPVILANSRWSAMIASSAMRGGFDPRAAEQVQRISLGAPTSAYQRVPRAKARQELDIDADDFVIAFSVSSLSDERKGGSLLLEALEGLRLSGITLLLIGNQDRPVQVDGVKVVSLGYVHDPEMIALALCASNVYVGPSIEETLGQVFIEAAILGVPSIGFDQSGVKDAIVDGVTGLRLPCSSQALREALASLYADRARCSALGQWAAIYGRNEFSLETSYRSLFHVWDRLGLVDRWQLPHRIGFSRTSEFVPQPAAKRTWRPESGISAIEGPMPPDLPTRFQWCHGPRSSIRVFAGEHGRLRVRLSYYCPLFDTMTVMVGCRGWPQQAIVLHRTSGGALGSVEITVDAGPAWNSLAFEPDRRQPARPEERRELSFMIHTIDVLEVEH